MTTAKTIFISYSWDNEKHKEWVLKLAENLVRNGIDVLFDQYDLSAGKEMTYFMEKSITADKVIVIMTPNYKLKADKREGGVGYEYSLLSKEYYDKEPDKERRIIPVLKDGNDKESCPSYMQGIIFHDMREDNLFDAKFFELIKLIIGKPLIVKPPLGKLPDFNDNPTPDIDKTILDFQKKEELYGKKNSIINSEQGTQLFLSNVTSIVEQISESLENYKNNFGLHFYIRKTPRPSILFSTVNYTFYFHIGNLARNSAFDATVNLDFFNGPVGFEDLLFDYSGKKEVIYRTNYKFSLDDNLNPIFVKSDNPNIILTANEIATIGVREVIVNEIKHRENELG